MGTRRATRVFRASPRRCERAFVPVTPSCARRRRVSRGGAWDGAAMAANARGRADSPYRRHRHRADIAFSEGVVQFAVGGDAEPALQAADEAMYAVKAAKISA